MIKTNINFKNHYLKEYKKLNWYRKPKIVFKKKKINAILGLLMAK